MTGRPPKWTPSPWGSSSPAAPPPAGAHARAPPPSCSKSSRGRHANRFRLSRRVTRPAGRSLSPPPPAPPSDFTLQFKSAHPLAAWANSPTSSTQARFRSSSSRQRGMTQLLPREQGRGRAGAFCVPSLGAGVGRLMLRRALVLDTDPRWASRRLSCPLDPRGPLFSSNSQHSNTPSPERDLCKSCRPLVPHTELT